MSVFSPLNTLQSFIQGSDGLTAPLSPPQNIGHSQDTPTLELLAIFPMMPPGRRRTGTTSAASSRTAILGTIAARANLVPDAKRTEFFIREGLDARKSSISEALRARKRPSDAPFGQDPAERDWLWDSYDVDATKLGLEMIVAWLPRPSDPEPRHDQADLLAALRETRGVIRLQDCMDDTVLVTALTATPLDKQRLQLRLRELCPNVLWAEVRESDRDQARRGWTSLARLVALQEGRLNAESEEQ
jgi:hypothetical protein